MPSMIAYQYSEELDAISCANSPSFTTLPVRIRKDNSRSQKICAKFLAAWSKIGVKSTSPPLGTQCSFGHFVSLVIPECPPDKIALITKLCDYGFIENGWLSISLFLIHSPLSFYKKLTKQIYWRHPTWCRW